MNRERLKEAIKCLENVIEKNKKFRMDKWIDPESLTLEFLNKFQQPIPDMNPNLIGEHPKVKDFCQTACCAFGHMAFWPPFIKQGLRIDIEKGLRIEVYGRVNVAFEAEWGSGAAKKFFGLAWRKSVYLFDPGSYLNPYSITPQDVIERIKKLLNDSEDLK